MSQTPITIKIDTNVKHEAQKLAKSLGLSLSSIVENKLKEAILDRRIVFSEEFTLNEKTAKDLNLIEEDIKAKRNISGPFASLEELEAHLKSV